MGLGCKNGPKVVPNRSPENYCKVSNGHVIRHVLVGQNKRSTNMPIFGRDHEFREYEWNEMNYTKELKKTRNFVLAHDAINSKINHIQGKKYPK